MSNHWEPLVSQHHRLSSIFFHPQDLTIGVVSGKSTLDKAKLIPMESRSYNGSRGSREAQGEYPIVSRTPGKR